MFTPKDTDLRFVRWRAICDSRQAVDFLKPWARGSIAHSPVQSRLVACGAPTRPPRSSAHPRAWSSARHEIEKPTRDRHEIENPTPNLTEFLHRGGAPGAVCGCRWRGSPPRRGTTPGRPGTTPARSATAGSPRSVGRPTAAPACRRTVFRRRHQVGVGLVHRGAGREWFPGLRFGFAGAAVGLVGGGQVRAEGRCGDAEVTIFDRS